MKSKVTVAQALIATLKNYRSGMNYESLVDVMRDLAVEQYEEFKFADGSVVAIAQSDRLDDGSYSFAKVEIGDDPDHSLVAGEEGE